MIPPGLVHEMARSILDGCIYSDDYGTFCIHCEKQQNGTWNVETGDYDEVHDKDCIVTKIREALG